MRKLLGSLAAACVLAMPAGAQSSYFIDFHEFASPVVTEYPATIGFPLTSGGLDFYQEFDAGARNVLGTWGYADATAVNRPVNIGTSTTLFGTQTGNEVDLYAAGADPVLGRYTPFSLHSIDVAHVYSNPFSPFTLANINFRVYGFGAGGATFFEDFVIPAPPSVNGVRRPVLQTLTFTNPRFQSAYNVWFYNGSTNFQTDALTAGSGLSVQFTNLAVTVAPEPGSFALMATGLVGVMGVAARRRRRQSSAA
jgi:hypothetical protein